jgi:asparagine synthase (glutamine-hydrolysing)
MCGLIAILSPERPVEEGPLRRAMHALRHRGPDGEGCWLSPDRRVGLGHVRLGIIDLDTGAQPLLSEDGQLALIVNGEFYDFERIRRDLERRGHRFRSRSDSEIALHLYEEHGIDFLHHLRGEFALVLWDGRNRQLVAARDRFGIKPLCWTEQAGTLYLASESKALFAAGVRTAWDATAMFQATSMQYVPPERTLFQGISQLRPGHYILADGGAVETLRWWDLDYPPDTDCLSAANEADHVEELRHRLTEAVRLRLRADVPVCCHLSGGLDSSAVAAIAARYTARPLTCFTVSFPAEGYDELAPAEEMAHYLGADLHPLAVTQAGLLAALPDAVYFSEGLAINGHLSAKFLLHRAIRAAGFKVALTGEGADEILAGYPHLRRDLLLAAGDSGQRLEELYASNAVIAGIQLSEGPSLPLDAVERALHFVPSFLEAKGALGQRMRPLLSRAFLDEFRERDCFQSLLNGFDVRGQLAGRHRVHQALYLWTKLALANYILRTLGDGTEMAHAVEGRLPFLDHPLFEFVRRLPLSLKIKGGVEKYVLREAVRPLVTETVYRRQKHPFTAPPLSRFSTPALDGRLREMLDGPGLRSIPFFDRAAVLRLLDELPRLPARERAATDPVLMLVLTASLIQERFSL